MSDWRLQRRLAGLLAQLALLAEDVTPAGEAEYLEVMDQIEQQLEVQHATGSEFKH
jgi:hypothetical protein